MSLIHCKIYIRRIVPILHNAREITIASFEFRFIRDRHFTFSRLLDLRNYVCGGDTNISTSRWRNSTILWASLLHKFFRLYLVKFTGIYLPELFNPLRPSQLPNILFLQHYRSTSDNWSTITSARAFLEVVETQSKSSSSTVPSLVLATVMYAYVNIRHFVRRLRILFSVTLTI
jgi:hypothetical protein